MPAQRDPSQTIITISLSKNLLKKVDDVCRRLLRGAPRAQLMRDALQDYLKHKHAVDVEDADVSAPPRFQSHALNETSNTPPVKQPRREVKYSKPQRKK